MLDPDRAFADAMADLDRRLASLRLMFGGRHATAIDALRTVLALVTAAATDRAAAPDR